MKKVQVSLHEDLVKKMDAYADENYLTRSALITLSCTQYMNQNNMTKAIAEVSLAIRKIADSGTIDEESEKQLKDFEYLVQMLLGK